MAMNPAALEAAGRDLAGTEQQIGAAANGVRAIAFHDYEAGRRYVAMGAAIDNAFDRVAACIDLWKDATRANGNALMETAKATRAVDVDNAGKQKAVGDRL